MRRLPAAKIRLVATKTGDLSITALYTSEAWRVFDFSCADLFATRQAGRIFRLTNGGLRLACIFRKEVPWLPASLKLRHETIDFLAERSGADTIVELAAGLSPRGAAMSARDGLVYTEVDTGSVIEKKRALLSRTERGRTILDRPNYRLVPGDLRGMELTPLVAQGGRLLVIAEGLLMYLDARARDELFRRVSALVRNTRSVRFVFDLVPGSEEPPPGRLGRLLGRVFRKKTGGAHFVRDKATRESIRKMLLDAGFSRVSVYDESRLPDEFEQRPTEPVKLVLFDAAMNEAP